MHEANLCLCVRRYHNVGDLLIDDTGALFVSIGDGGDPDNVDYGQVRKILSLTTLTVLCYRGYNDMSYKDYNYNDKTDYNDMSDTI